MYRISGRRDCIVPGCASSQRDLSAWRREACTIHPLHLHHVCECKEPFSFFSFPEDIKEQQAWLRAVGKPDNFFIRKNMVICSKHFIGGAPTEENPEPVLNLYSRDSASDLGKETPGVLHTPKRKRGDKDIVGETDGGEDPTNVSQSPQTTFSIEGRYPQGSWEQGTVEAIMNLRSFDITATTAQIAQTIIANLKDENDFLRMQNVNMRSELKAMQWKHEEELHDLQERLETVRQKCSCGARSERTDSEGASVAKIGETSGHSLKTVGPADTN